MSWLDWSLAAADQDLLQFTETLARLRRDHPVFRRRRFFRGSRDGPGRRDQRHRLADPAGQEMTQQDWHADYAQSLAVFLNGEAISEPDPRGGQDHRRQVPAAVQRAWRADHVHPARGQLGRRLGGRDRHRDGRVSDEGSGSVLMPKSEVEVVRPGRHRAAVRGLICASCLTAAPT